MDERLKLGKADQKPTHQRHILSVILLITLLIAYVDRINISILIADPHFLADMQLVGQPVKMGMLMTVFLFAYGVCSFLLAPLGDYLGPRKAMVLAIAVWILSLIIGGMASVFALLIVSRILLGIGEGLHFPTQSTFVKNWFPIKERGRANMMWGMGMTLAPVVSMPLVVALVYFGGWRFSFFGLAALDVLPLLLIWYLTTDTPRQNKRVNGAEIEVIESGLAEERKAQSKLAQGSFVQNIKGLASNYSYWLLVLYLGCLMFAYFGIVTWLPAYLTNTRGFSWAAMGALASLPGIAGFFMKLLSGYVVDKFARRAPILFIGMIGIGTGIYLSVAVANNLVAAILIAVGVSFMSFSTPAAYTLLQDLAPSRIISTASGVLTGVSSVMSAFAPMSVGWVIGITGRTESGIAFLSAVSVLGACCALLLILRKH
jgi:sugar phosphate permease